MNVEDDFSDGEDAAADSPGDPLGLDKLVEAKFLRRQQEKVPATGSPDMRYDTQTSLNREKDFDLTRYEALQEKPVIRRLTIADWPEIGELYQRKEIPEDTFHLLIENESDEFKTAIQGGNYIDRWTPKPEELERLRARNPEYVPSGEEFATFLEGTHPRSADFLAYGHFHPATGKLLSIVSGFFPPKDPDARERHGVEVANFFASNDPEGKKFYPHGNDDEFAWLERAETTAEFYLVGSDVEGLAATDFEEMLQQPEIRERGITDWYLLRFGSVRMLEPRKDLRVACDSPNIGSGRLFSNKLGFNDYGHFVDHNQFAARKIRGGEVVVVRPGWIVMHGEDAHVRSCSHTWSEHLKKQARNARKKPPAS